MSHYKHLHNLVVHILHIKIIKSTIILYFTQYLSKIDNVFLTFSVKHLKQDMASPVLFLKFS